MYKKNIKALMSLGLVLFSMTSIAADWQRIDNSDQVRVYFDKSSIARYGDFGKVWMRYEYTPPKVYENLSYSVQSNLMVINCRNHTYAGKQSSLFSENGDFLGTVKRPPSEMSFDDIPPGTAIDFVFPYVCNQHSHPRKSVKKLHRHTI